MVIIDKAPTTMPGCFSPGARRAAEIKRFRVSQFYRRDSVVKVIAHREWQLPREELA